MTASVTTTEVVTLPTSGATHSKIYRIDVRDGETGEPILTFSGDDAAESFTAWYNDRMKKHFKDTP